MASYFFGISKIIHIFIDINECDNNNGGCSQNCSNTVGSFSCSCTRNFTLDDDNRTCNGNLSPLLYCCYIICAFIDINECLDPQMFPCPSTLLCSNTIGGYDCICPDGTMFDGVICGNTWFIKLLVVSEML